MALVKCGRIGCGHIFNTSSANRRQFPGGIYFSCTGCNYWVEEPGFETKTPVIPVRLENLFPHLCPRCNRKAYIGLNKVEHEDPLVEATCR